MSVVIINGVEYKLQAIYQPKGAAGEYADLAVNLVIGCRNGCRYCYGPVSAHKKREEFHQMPRTRVGILADLESDCQKLPAGSRIFMQFLSDPYQNEESSDLTRIAMNIIHDYGHYADVLTKSQMVERDTAQFRPGHSFGTTLTFQSAHESALWEPRAASPHIRMNQLAVMHGRGIRTWVSLEPVIDPEQSLQLIGQAAPYADEFRVGRLNHLGRINWPSSEWRNRVEAVDWSDFTRNAIEALNKTGRSYLIKESLREFLPAGAKAEVRL